MGEFDDEDCDITAAGSNRGASEQAWANGGPSIDGISGQPAPGCDPSSQPNPYYYAPPQVIVPADAGLLHKWKAKGGILGAIAGILLAIVKVFGPVLAVLGKVAFLGKFLITGVSMVASMWLYAMLFGWPFGVGMVILILFHECGHVIASYQCGRKYGLMVFVPLMGAFVTSKGIEKSPASDAYLAIVGPVVGGIASVATACVYFVDRGPFWLALAQWGFLINLLNLLPVPPLDGGWIAPLFSPKELACGALLLAGLCFLNPLIIVLLVVVVARAVAGWNADSAAQRHSQVAVADRWRHGLAYIGVTAVLAIGWTITVSAMSAAAAR
jgi:Zn-dependent protease